MLDAVLRDRSDLQDCAVRCCHCSIRFLTHPRNARRQNLRCPFGCREHHRRQLGNQRSKKYYQTNSGRRNKKRINSKRSQTSNPLLRENPSPPDIPTQSNPRQLSTTGPSSSDPSTSDPSSSDRFVPTAADATESPIANPLSTEPQSQWAPELSCESTTLALDGLLLDEATLMNSHMLPYVCMVASLLERRTIHSDELVATLRKSMRQRSIGLRPRREYVLSYLNQHPP